MENKIFSLYNGEVKIEFKESNHSYWTDSEELKKDGTPKRKRLTGVTTYLGIIDKSTPLLYWQAGIITDYIRNHLGDLEKSANEILKLAKEEANRQKEEAADIGSKIHAWIESYIKGENPEMPEDNNVILGATNFLEWEEKHKAKFIWSEQIVYSKKYGYVGTADFAVEINGKKYLGDIKTGNAIYEEVKLQTAAYLMARQEETGEKYHGRIVLRVSKETQEEYIARMEKKGKADYPEFKVFEDKFLDEENEAELEKDFEGFIHCLRLKQWQKQAKI